MSNVTYGAITIAEIDRLTADLGKRPVAFRVKNNIGCWVYYDDEERAAKSAERQNTDYQGLYVRDGT